MAISVGSQDFIQAWETALAFRNQRVLVGKREAFAAGLCSAWSRTAVSALMADETATIVHFGEIHLRPQDDKIE